MGRSRCAVFVAIACTVACAPQPPEQRAIEDAAKALGGVQRLAALKIVTIEATGSAPNAGQNRMPEDDLPVWKVNEYTRTIDLEHGRTRVRQVREAQFLFAGDLVQRQVQGLDGSVGYNVAPDGSATRAGDAAARERRIELLHHPLTAIRAAMEPGARLANFRRNGSEELLDVTTTEGDIISIALDAQTHLPSRVISLADHPNMGDVALVTTFREYEEAGGVKVPRRVTTMLDRYLQLDLQITKTLLKGDATGLEAPEAIKSAAPPAVPPVVVTAEPVGKGVWWLAGSGNHRSVVFEFADHLVLYEVPLNESRTKAVIDKARSLSAKPLTTAIVSHHHFDHSGGLRTAVAEGLTIVTHRANEAFFKDLLARPHTIAPDMLQQQPKDATFVFVDDQLALKDASMEVRLYHLLDNPREGTNLFAYVPAQRLLVQADLYDSTWQRHSWGGNVLTNISQRKLVVDRDVPVHGAIESFSQMVATIKAKAGNTPGTD